MRRATALTLSILTALAAALLGLLPSAPAARADSIRDREYWLGEYGIEKAWEVSKGAGVKVAVIDSGIDGTHPDLHGAVVGGHDSSGAGSPDGQKPIGAKPEHGTLVATMLAGRGHGQDPGKDGVGPDGIVGVAPEAQLLSASTWLGSPNPAGISDQAQIPDAVRWAVDQGAKVINISLGSSSPVWPESWDSAFLYAEQHDVVIVAAAGNRVGGNVQVGAPATIPGVLTVAGLDRQRKASVDSSSQGISIGVAAPAEELAGGLPGGEYAEWAGTSGAAPIVSGVAALIRSKWPDMSAAQVINRIVSTAKDAGAPGPDPIYGRGILDAEAALKADVPVTSVNPLGSIADWIRVHRKGAGPAPTAPDETAAPTAPATAVPEPSAPTPRNDPAESPWPALTVVLSAVLVLGTAAGGGLHVWRRSVRSPAGGAALPPDAAASAEPEESHPGS
ncbi:S8 family serine peptidase [Sinomonas atrocyanea]|uniref:S8 family serine peptidase n=1 Tax=Sinomonas atrocyanea TaxID=37927 RepID=UPI00083136FB|nr:S8 family serine peptidase [Sinomonas atrocyanea]